jgi:hypothetical protein
MASHAGRVASIADAWRVELKLSQHGHARNGVGDMDSWNITMGESEARS